MRQEGPEGLAGREHAGHPDDGPGDRGGAATDLDIPVRIRPDNWIFPFVPPPVDPYTRARAGMKNAGHRDDGASESV